MERRSLVSASVRRTGSAREGNASMSGCDVLFRQFFARWYRLPPNVEPPRITKGDLEVYDDLAGQPVTAISRLHEDRRAELADQVSRMVSAAKEDWRSYLDTADVVSLQAIDAFDGYWTRARIADLLRRSARTDFQNDYLVVCCELGAVLGEVMRGLRPGLQWLHDSPYWESSLWHAASGSQVNVFHWAIKKMSAYGAEDGLRPKVLCALDQLDHAA